MKQRSKSTTQLFKGDEIFDCGSMSVHEADLFVLMSKLVFEIIDLLLFLFEFVAGDKCDGEAADQGVAAEEQEDDRHERAREDRGLAAVGHPDVEDAEDHHFEAAGVQIHDEERKAEGTLNPL